MATTKNKIKSLLEDVNELSSRTYHTLHNYTGYTLYDESNRPIASCLSAREVYNFLQGYYNALILELS